MYRAQLTQNLHGTSADLHS